MVCPFALPLVGLLVLSEATLCVKTVALPLSLLSGYLFVGPPLLSFFKLSAGPVEASVCFALIPMGELTATFAVMEVLAICAALVLRVLFVLPPSTLAAGFFRKLAEVSLCLRLILKLESTESSTQLFEVAAIRVGAGFVVLFVLCPSLLEPPFIVSPEPVEGSPFVVRATLADVEVVGPVAVIIAFLATCAGLALRFLSAQRGPPALPDSCPGPLELGAGR